MTRTVIQRQLLGLVLAAMAAAATAMVSAQAVEAPKATEVERLRLEGLGLRQQLGFVIAQRDICEGKLAGATYQEAMAQLEQERQALIAAFEKEHPGYTLDTKTGEAIKKTEPPHGD